MPEGHAAGAPRDQSRVLRVVEGGPGNAETLERHREERVVTEIVGRDGDERLPSVLAQPKDAVRERRLDRRADSNRVLERNRPLQLFGGCTRRELEQREGIPARLRNHLPGNVSACAPGREQLQGVGVGKAVEPEFRDPGGVQRRALLVPRREHHRDRVGGRASWR